jgi:hypothetical protein
MPWYMRVLAFDVYEHWLTCRESRKLLNRSQCTELSIHSALARKNCGVSKRND